MSAFLITGRSLKNYRAKGHSVPENIQILPCIVCGDEVTISASGAAKLAEHQAAGDMCGAFCTPCAVRKTPRGAHIELSAFAMKLVEDREDAKAILSELLRRAAS